MFPYGMTISVGDITNTCIIEHAARWRRHGCRCRRDIAVVELVVAMHRACFRLEARDEVAIVVKRSRVRVWS